MEFRPNGLHDIDDRSSERKDLLPAFENILLAQKDYNCVLGRPGGLHGGTFIMAAPISALCRTYCLDGEASTKAGQ